MSAVRAAARRTVEAMPAAGGPGAPVPRHFLDLRDLDADTLRRMLDLAARLKRAGHRGRSSRPGEGRPLEGRCLGLMLEKPSTRTRVSFEVAIRQMGGDAVVLSPRDMQLGRGESLPDTARVLSRFLDAIVLRTDDPAKLHELAAWATVPVINGLTAVSHPVQLLADVLTFEEQRGPIAGRTVAWSGDGNNVLSSWIEAAVRFGFTLRAATPAQRPPAAAVLDWARREGGRIEICSDAAEAVRNAACVVTDTWSSMADEAGSAAERERLLEPFRVDEALMRRADPDAIFMHCLPAHRGEEVTDAVIEGRWSVVFDEAENRLHAQKALLAWCLGGVDWDAVGSGA